MRIVYVLLVMTIILAITSAYISFLVYQQTSLVRDFLEQERKANVSIVDFIWTKEPYGSYERITMSLTLYNSGMAIAIDVGIAVKIYNALWHLVKTEYFTIGDVPGHQFIKITDLAIISNQTEYLNVEVTG